MHENRINSTIADLPAEEDMMRSPSARPMNSTTCSTDDIPDISQPPADTGLTVDQVVPTELNSLQASKPATDLDKPRISGSRVELSTVARAPLGAAIDPAYWTASSEGGNYDA